MKTAEFQDTVRELKLNADGTVRAYGIVNGWPVAITNGTGLSITVDKPGREEVKALKEKLKPYASVGMMNGVLTVNLRPKKYDGTAAALAEYAVKTIQETGFTLKDECPYCKQGRCDSAALKYYSNCSYMDRYHRNCHEAHIEKLKDNEEENMHSGSYILGLIGAVIGMIAGCIPCFLTIVYLERIWAYLFALIPICAFYGYKLLKGRMNIFAIIISVIMAVLGVYAIDFATLGHTVMTMYDLSLSDCLQIMPQLISDPGVWAELTGESLQMFLFAALGVFISWGVISKTGAKGIQNARNISANAIDYPVYTYTEE